MTGTKSPLPIGSPAETIRQTFVLKNRQGLHFRPAALLIKTLHRFTSKVMVKANGMLVNGRSILGLMTLSAAFGTRMTFSVTGSDAKESMATIKHLFETNFAEAYEPV